MIGSVSPSDAIVVKGIAWRPNTVVLQYIKKRTTHHKTDNEIGTANYPTAHILINLFS